MVLWEMDIISSLGLGFHLERHILPLKRLPWLKRYRKQLLNHLLKLRNKIQMQKKKETSNQSHHTPLLLLLVADVVVHVDYSDNYLQWLNSWYVFLVTREKERKKDLSNRKQKRWNYIKCFFLVVYIVYFCVIFLYFFSYSNHNSSLFHPVDPFISKKLLLSYHKYKDLHFYVLILQLFCVFIIKLQLHREKK